MKILEVVNLSKKYNERSGVFHFNLEVENNDIILLLGPNGAGKTTAFRSVLGLLEVDYDKIDILNIDVKQKDSLRKVGAMVSKPAFYDYLSGYDHLRMCEHVYKNVDNYRIDQVLTQVGLIDVKNKAVSTYSTGMKQRLDLARAIVHRPNLLLLDEPFSGMDIEAKHDLKKVLKDLQENSDTGIMISSHMVGDLEHFANKVLIIYEGHTLFQGDMEKVKSTGLTLEEFYLEKIEHYKKGA